MLLRSNGREFLILTTPKKGDPFRSRFYNGKTAIKKNGITIQHSLVQKKEMLLPTIRQRTRADNSSYEYPAVVLVVSQTIFTAILSVVGLDGNR